MILETVLPSSNMMTGIAMGIVTLYIIYKFKDKTSYKDK